MQRESYFSFLNIRFSFFFTQAFVAYPDDQ